VPHPGEVYNLGGGRVNSCSILEAFGLIEAISERKMVYEYSDTARRGTYLLHHNLNKMKAHYPYWSITKGLDDILKEIYSSWCDRVARTFSNDSSSRTLYFSLVTTIAHHPAKTDA
jgi:CDP-paratose 2-epimerase